MSEITKSPTVIIGTRAKDDTISWFGWGVIGVLFLLFAWPSLTILNDIYSSEDDYSHGFMVPLVSLLI